MQPQPGPPFGPPGPPSPGYGAAGYGPPPPRPSSKLPILIAVGCLGALVIGGILVALAGAGVSRYLDQKKSITSSPSCVKAVACCHALAEKAGTPPGACDAAVMAATSEAVCRQSLTAYEKSAKASGLNCHP